MQVELEPGKVLNLRMMVEGELRDDGQREVYLELNGQSRIVMCRDENASKVR